MVFFLSFLTLIINCYYKFLAESISILKSNFEASGFTKRFSFKFITILDKNWKKELAAKLIHRKVILVMSTAITTGAAESTAASTAESASATAVSTRAHLSGSLDGNLFGHLASNLQHKNTQASYLETHTNKLQNLSCHNYLSYPNISRFLPMYKCTITRLLW